MSSRAPRSRALAEGGELRLVIPASCMVLRIFALTGVSAEDQAKTVAAMKGMKNNPSGARAMRSLGVDAWINFDASMLH